MHGERGIKPMSCVLPSYGLSRQVRVHRCLASFLFFFSSTTRRDKRGADLMPLIIPPGREHGWFRRKMHPAMKEL